MLESLKNNLIKLNCLIINSYTENVTFDQISNYLPTVKPLILIKSYLNSQLNPAVIKREKICKANAEIKYNYNE